MLGSSSTATSAPVDDRRCEVRDKGREFAHSGVTVAALPWVDAGRV